MITHIKRSIPDLRAIKHQPLENKESPSDSPRHHGENGAGTSAMPGRCSVGRNQAALGMDILVTDGRETEAITLSAVHSSGCTCRPVKNIPTDNANGSQVDKGRCEQEEDEAMLESNSHHHHYYHPYQHHHQPHSMHEMG